MMILTEIWYFIHKNIEIIILIEIKNFQKKLVIRWQYVLMFLSAIAFVAGFLLWNFFSLDQKFWFIIKFLINVKILSVLKISYSK